MDRLTNLITRPPSPLLNAEHRQKLDRASESILADQLEVRLERLRRTESPPRRLSPYTVYFRACLENSDELTPPTLSSGSNSSNSTESTSNAATVLSQDTCLTPPSPGSLPVAEICQSEDLLERKGPCGSSSESSTPRNPRITTRRQVLKNRRPVTYTNRIEPKGIAKVKYSRSERIFPKPRHTMTRSKTKLQRENGMCHGPQ